ncbi:hypothetical protein HD806DRAFT_542703 [Xylariaceae sp. AK1471]|nr:hypothetical protein HD806DRAFT_542703 [Xylariaceae sp. AK1471]
MNSDLQQVVDAVVQEPKDVDAVIQFRIALAIDPTNPEERVTVEGLHMNVNDLSMRLSLRLARWYNFHNRREDAKTVLMKIVGGSADGHHSQGTWRAFVDWASENSYFQEILEVLEDEEQLRGEEGAGDWEIGRAHCPFCGNHVIGNRLSLINRMA